MVFNVFEGKEHGIWIVEAVNTEGEGEMLWAKFYGSESQERAKEYAKWMNARLAARRSRHQYSQTVPLGSRSRRAKQR